MKKAVLLLMIVVATMFTTACNDEANVADYNLTRAADNFEIYRRVVFYNGITDEYILTVEGYCSISDYNGQLEVIMKKKDGTFLKHHLGLSDNVTYFSEQLTGSDVSKDHYRIIFRPQTIIPTIEVK